MFKFLHKWRRPQLKATITRKGVKIAYRAKNPEQVMHMVYTLLQRVAKAHNVDIRYYIKKILEVNTRHKKLVKESEETRDYKKKLNKKKK